MLEVLEASWGAFLWFGLICLEDDASWGELLSFAVLVELPVLLLDRPLLDWEFGERGDLGLRLRSLADQFGERGEDDSENSRVPA